MEFQSDVILKVDFPDQETLEFGINIRPYCRELLKELQKDFEIIIFTASHKFYAEKVIDFIDPDNFLIDHKLFKENCIQTPEGVHIKDLRILKNRKLENIVIVDNAAYSFGYQIQNGIPIIPYYDNRSDFELKYLEDFLKKLAYVQDVRNFLVSNFRMHLYANCNNIQEALEKFRNYSPTDKLSYSKSRANSKRGNCPPSFPNGWFRICQKSDIEIGYSKYFKINGRHLALFRGEDSQVYALDAFCAHMGANLGIGGKVKWNSCIECPFHGWTFDGKTGKVVNSEYLDEKETVKYEYCDIQEMKKGSEGTYLVKQQQCKGGTQQKKYHVCEKNNLIYVWFHSKDIPPQYEIFDIIKFEQNKEDRGETLDYVNCQIQEIPENGADFKHFDYIHYAWVEMLFPWFKFKWVPKDRKPTDKDFDEVMRKHWNKNIEGYQNRLFDKYLNEKNKTYLNNLVIDTYLVIFDRFQIHVETVTVFQLGPSTVFLFLKFLFCDLVVVQSVSPLEKFSQVVHHKMFAPWWVPYWFSCYIMAQFRKQFIADKFIWNNKIFQDKLNYNPKCLFDSRLKIWREWYSQYFEGTKEFEDSIKEMDW